MKRLLAMILVLTLVLGCVPATAFAEDTTNPTTAPTEAPTEVPPTVTTISVATAPAKMEYLVGDALDLTGGSVSVNKSDGTSETVDMSVCATSGFDSSTAGTYSVMLTYAGCTTSFDVTVTQPQPEVTVTGISVAVLPSKTQYGANETLDVSGGEITVFYSDGSTQNVAMTAEMVSGFNNTVSCTQTLTVTYEGFEAYFDVTVTIANAVSSPESDDLEVTAITMLTQPTKYYYLLNNDVLDVSGGELKVSYSNGSISTIPMQNNMVTGFDSAVLGTQVLTVTYEGQIAEFEIEVIEKHYPVSYWISVEPQTAYFLNEPLNLSGMMVTLTYTDGTSVDLPITESMVTGFDSATTGTKQLQIDAEGLTIPFDITVIDTVSGRCGETVLWSLNASGELTISSNSWNEVVVSNPDDTWYPYRDLVKTVAINGYFYSTGDNLFNDHRNLETIKLSGSFQEIGESAFYLCIALTSVPEMPSVRNIGDDAFFGCKSLSSITFSDNLESIGNNAFGQCSALKNLTFPASLNSIGVNAFMDCTALSEITFTGDVESIGEAAFEDCNSLTKITFEGNRSPSITARIFHGVTATGYYPGTRGWDDTFIEQCGGNINWLATGAKGIEFGYVPYSIKVGDESSLLVNSIYGNTKIDCDFTVDNDIVTIHEYVEDKCWIIANKPGTATVTAKDKRSGYTATTTVTVISKNRTITCPYEESFRSDSQIGFYDYYTFTPTQTGTYVFSWTNNNGYNVSPYDFVYEAYYYDVNGVVEFPECISNVTSGDSAHIQLALEKDITYSIGIGYSPINESDNIPLDGALRVDLATEPTSIEIVGGDRILYGAVGETFWDDICYKQYPENAAANIVWESSNPAVANVEWYYDIYRLSAYGIGTAEITVSNGEHSDTITVTVKEPQKLELNTPVEKTGDTNQIFSFTPTETGRYAFAVQYGGDYGGGSFNGKYCPDDMRYAYSAQSSIDFGILTAGVTYYYEVYGDSAVVTVRKEEAHPIAIEVESLSYRGDTMYFQASFVPANSYETIVAWESSNTDILECPYTSTGATSPTFYIYGSGEVTVTAISESGLRGSCTIILGECYNGHTYGEWKQTRAKTCLRDGEETATCICGITKTQPIPATGHRYDNDCDTACNECGATRTALHDFSEKWGYSETVHWHICSICGERSDIENHIPGAAATESAPQSCTECGYVIKGALGHSHSYGAELTVDETGHWYACSGCNARKNYNAHVYTSVCDAECNECGYTRKNVHVSGGTWVSDKAGHWQACTKCNTKLNYAAHHPGAAATANTAQICSICRYEIQKALGTTTTTTVVQAVTKPANHTHNYSTMLIFDEVGHWYACSGCTSKRDYKEHDFGNDCDADCNICGYTRSVSHATEAQWSADEVGHWYSCKDCGERVGYAYHVAENGICLICKHAVKETEKSTEALTEATIPIPTEETIVIENTVDSSQGDSGGASVWMMIVAGMVSSIATFGIIAFVVWINRKKIIALLIGK